jgi:hypothetical protein
MALTLRARWLYTRARLALLLRGGGSGLPRFALAGADGYPT